MNEINFFLSRCGCCFLFYSFLSSFFGEKIECTTITYLLLCFKHNTHVNLMILF